MAEHNSINRRQFLKKATTVAAGAIGFPYIVRSSALGKAGTVAPSNRIVMGCIGVGGQGIYDMKAFLNNPDVQVVAVCDVSTSSDYKKYYWGWDAAGREPARKVVDEYYGKQMSSGTYKGCAAYNDFRDVLGRDDIDVVTICTPDHWHGLISVAAAKAGKDIYCEKPLVNTIAEGRAVVSAVKNYGRILQTGSHERSNDSVRFACELVQNGRIGKLHTIRVNMPNTDKHHDIMRENSVAQPVTPVPGGFDYDFWLGPAAAAPYTDLRCHLWWRFIMDYGGGEMTDRGAHIIDLAQLGNDTDDTGPIEISGQGKALRGGVFNVFMDYTFECKYANGVRLIGSSNEPRGLKFEGTDGWIFIHIHGGRLEAEPKSLLAEFIGPNEKHLGRSGGHHRNFLEAVKTRRQPVAPAEVGHRTATICHLVNIALLTGSKLKWDPQREQITNDSAANRMVARPMRSPWSL